jgi:hypothetical protein
VINANGRTLVALAAEVKDELKQFLVTRYEMLISEVKEKVAAWKTSLPLILVGVVLLGTAWLLFTGALVAVISIAFYDTPYKWFLSLLMVFAIYAVAGVVCALFAYRELRANGLVPERTLRVLKQDQIWLQNEARSQL